MSGATPETEAPSRVVVVAPFGRDHEVLSRIVAAHGCEPAATGREAGELERTARGADALVLTAEACTPELIEPIEAALGDEPIWSHPPVVIIGEDLRHAEATSRRLRRARPGLAVAILLRPCAEIELSTAVGAALENRAQQRRVRDELDRRQAAEAQAEFLYEELSHRVQNVFAMVAAIGRRTYAASGSAAEFNNAFGERIQALSNVYAALRGSRGQEADLERVVEGAVGSLLAQGQDRERLSVSGPQVQVEANLASNLGLVLHELASNARKYGALSIRDGRVDIAWRREAAGRVALAWREIGGPPVAPPERKGFGTQVITTAMSGVEGAELDYSPEPDGVRCDIRFPRVDGRDG